MNRAFEDSIRATVDGLVKRIDVFEQREADQRAAREGSHRLMQDLQGQLNDIARQLTALGDTEKQCDSYNDVKKEDYGCEWEHLMKRFEDNEQKVDSMSAKLDDLSRQVEAPTTPSTSVGSESRKDFEMAGLQQNGCISEATLSSIRNMVSGGSVASTGELIQPKFQVTRMRSSCIPHQEARHFTRKRSTTPEAFHPRGCGEQGGVQKVMRVLTPDSHAPKAVVVGVGGGSLTLPVRMTSVERQRSSGGVMRMTSVERQQSSGGVVRMCSASPVVARQSSVGAVRMTSCSSPVVASSSSLRMTSVERQHSRGPSYTQNAVCTDAKVITEIPVARSPRTPVLTQSVLTQSVESFHASLQIPSIAKLRNCGAKDCGVKESDTQRSSSASARARGFGVGLCDPSSRATIGTASPMVAPRTLAGSPRTQSSRTLTGAAGTAHMTPVRAPTLVWTPAMSPRA